MTGRFIGELLRRRVLQVLGVYLAAGWGLLEFSDWAEDRFVTDFPLTDVVIASWLILLPVVLSLAWRFGASVAAPLSFKRGATTGRSIAVLPFVNLSGSPDTEYLSDGISEEIINALTRVEGLEVVSRTSAFAYKGRSGDVRTIGTELNVASVLEGSVQLVDDRLRITTQLVSVADGYHLWSERFDRRMEDVFAIQDEIAENVVRALRVILREEEQHALTRIQTTNVRAYEYYLRGRQFFHQTRRKSLEFARQMFSRAIEIDPEYALAHAGIAYSSALIHMYYPSSQADLESANEASLRALSLDPDLAEAHVARGFALFLMKELDEAEQRFRAALELNPRLYEAHYLYARACFQQGRLDEAARLFAEANRVQESPEAAFFAAQSLEALGRKIEAEAAYRSALAVAERHMDLNPDDPRAATMRAVALCRLGQQAEGLHWAKQAVAIDPEDASVKYNVACLYALEGESEKAISCLEDAIAVGFGNRDWIEKDPDLDSLRGQPRFEALLARL